LTQAVCAGNAALGRPSEVREISQVPVLVFENHPSGMYSHE